MEAEQECPVYFERGHLRMLHLPRRRRKGQKVGAAREDTKER